MKNFFLLMVRFYQKFISPLKPKVCRFYPTCSEYAVMSLEKKKFWQANYLIIKRLLKCHPFNAGGYDPLT